MGENRRSAQVFFSNIFLFFFSCYQKSNYGDDDDDEEEIKNCIKRKVGEKSLCIYFLYLMVLKILRLPAPLPPDDCKIEDESAHRFWCLFISRRNDCIRRRVCRENKVIVRDCCRECCDIIYKAGKKPKRFATIFSSWHSAITSRHLTSWSIWSRIFRVVIDWVGSWLFKSWRKTTIFVTVVSFQNDAMSLRSTERTRVTLQHLWISLQFLV